MQFIAVFLGVLPPIIAIPGLGYFGRRNGYISDEIGRAVSKATLNVFLPAFIFLSIGQAKLHSTFFTVALLAWLIAGMQCVFCWSLSQTFSSVTRNGLLLLAAGMNSGNMGLPSVQMAFGDEALGYAIVFYVAWTLFIQTIGVWIATHEPGNAFASVKKVFCMPLPYAAIGGIVWNYFGLNPLWNGVPGVFQTIKIIGNVAPCAMLLALGIGLARAGASIASNGTYRVCTPIALGIVLRLIISPFFAWVITGLMETPWEISRVVILQSAMPAAVQALMIAEASEVTALADFVRKGILYTTSLCMISLPVVVFLLR